MKPKLDPVLAAALRKLYIDLRLAVADVDSAFGPAPCNGRQEAVDSKEFLAADRKVQSIVRQIAAIQDR